MKDKLKIILVQDGRHIDLIGIDRNQILTQKKYQMKMFCTDTTILNTRTTYRDLILITHTKLLFFSKNLNYKKNFWKYKLKSNINLAETQYSDL